MAATPGLTHAVYTALLIPGEYWTAVCYGQVEAGGPVDLYGSAVVRRSEPGGRWIGIAARAGTDGQPVTVILGRMVHTGPAQGTITAGAPVATSGQAGRQVRAAGLGAPSAGIALTSAADGHEVRWAH